MSPTSLDLLVVGATGRTGRHVVTQAMERGHRVRALARSVRADALPAGAVALPGSVLDPELVRDAVHGVDAIVVALSMVRSNPNNPWSRITTPPDLHPKAASLLTSAAAPTTRYVSLSAHGVGTSSARAGWMFMGLVHASNIGVAYRALARAEAVIARSELPWTVVRPTRLTNGPGRGLWRFPEERLGSRASIDRRDVAAALIRLAEGRDHLRRAVSLTG